MKRCLCVVLPVPPPFLQEIKGIPLPTPSTGQELSLVAKNWKQHYEKIVTASSSSSLSFYPRRKAWGNGNGRRGSVRLAVRPSHSSCAQLLLQVLCNLNQTFTEWLSSSAGFCDSIFNQGVIALVLNLHFSASERNSSSSVRNSSYSSYAIWTKLSQNDCHQVPQRIWSVFCDSIIYQGVIALLFKFTLCATPPTVLMRFKPNFQRMIVTKCRSIYCQYFGISLFNKELLPFV